MKPKISVTIGIPTYNRLHYLKEAVASALAQTYTDIEILISQNPHHERSTRQEIAEYCESLAARYPRVRYQLQRDNLGQTSNFNWLVDNAKGDYVFLIGDDDRLLPNAVEILMNAFDPAVSVIFGRRYIIDDKGNRLPRIVPQPNPDPSFFYGWPFTQYEVPAGRLADAELWAWRQAMGIETSLIRTEDFRRIRYRDDLDIPDIPFFILLAREGADFVFVPEYVTEYRFHRASSTSAGFVYYKPLFDALAPLPVGSTIEPHKHRILEMLAFKAITKCLMAGEVREARRLIGSRYYPTARTGLKGVICKACAALPETLGTMAFRSIYAARFGRGPAARLSRF